MLSQVSTAGAGEQQCSLPTEGSTRYSTPGPAGDGLGQSWGFLLSFLQQMNREPHD